MGATQRGSGLIELMIAVALGLSLIALAVVMYSSGLRMLHTNEATQQLREQGHFLIELMSHELAQAAYVHALVLGRPHPRGGLPYGVLGCDGRWFASGLPASVYPQAVAQPPCANVQPGQRADSLVVLYEAGVPVGIVGQDKAEIYSAEGADHASTCQGNNLPLVAHRQGLAPLWLPAADPLAALPAGTYVVTPLVLSHFYLDSAPKPGIVGGRLMCASAGRGGGFESPQPMAQGVMDLQIEYGSDDDGDGAVDRYLPASAIAGPAWGKVLSVRLCLLMRSEAVGVAPADYRYTSCDGVEAGYDAAQRGALFMAFHTTVQLRNWTSGKG